MKVMLTSTGFDNKNIETGFLSLLTLPPKEAKALFIPTALNSEEAKEYIPVFKEDLLKAGVLHANIVTYDLDQPLAEDALLKYDVVYVCPGSPEYLLERMRDTGFLTPLRRFMNAGGIYLGVSAGSDVAGNNFPDGLNLVNVHIVTHAEKGSEAGRIDCSQTKTIYLTDNQALLINGDTVSVIE